MSSKKHPFSFADSLYVRAVAETRVERQGRRARALVRNRIVRVVALSLEDATVLRRLAEAIQ
jgi:hypothetical protein